MDDVERLRAEVLIAKNHLAEMREQLQHMQQQLTDQAERLHLSDQERKILSGHEDGCVRVGELWPILRRVFGEAA